MKSNEYVVMCHNENVWICNNDNRNIMQWY